MDIGFDYTYKGVYVVRLITFIIATIIVAILYAYFANWNIIETIIISIGLIFFIIICGEIGKKIGW